MVFATWSCGLAKLSNWEMVVANLALQGKVLRQDPSVGFGGKMQCIAALGKPPSEH